LLDKADFIKSERSKKKKSNAKEREGSRMARGSVKLSAAAHPGGRQRRDNKI